MVIRELTEIDLQSPTRSAGNRDRFPILNVGECDVYSDGRRLSRSKAPKNIGRGVFQREVGALWPARRLWLMKKGTASK